MSAAGTVRASYEALNDGDIDGALAALAKDAEWHESGALPGTGSYHGREAIREFLTEFLASWDRFHQVVEETRAEGDRVGAFIHLTATGRGSSAEVDARYAHVWTMRRAHIWQPWRQLGVRVDAYYERDEALEALQRP